MKSNNYYFFIVVITMMASVSLFATDIYLPALPDMAVYFNCRQTDIQLSFTVFLLGLAISQLIAGMMSDQFGRKRVVVIGFMLFTLASFMCAFAASLPELIGWRLLQAIGGGVGSVTSRALVADRYDRKESVKIFSTIFPIVGLSAAVAPVAGGYLTAFFGWRANFLFIAVFGFFILISVFLCLSDNSTTQATEKKGNPFFLGIQGYGEVISNLEFLGYAFIICAGFCVFRTYSVESPFVFSGQGFAAEEMGHFFMALSCAYIAGNLLAKKFIQQMSVNAVLRIGFSVFILGGLIMICSTWLYANSPFALIIPMSLVTMGNGLLFPVASAAAVTAVRSDCAGTAAGLMGAMQCLSAAFFSHSVGELCAGGSFPLSIFIGTIILIGFSSYLLLIVYKPKVETSVSEDIP